MSKHSLSVKTLPTLEIMTPHYLREKVEEVLVADLLCLFLRFLTASVPRKQLTRFCPWAAFH